MMIRITKLIVLIFAFGVYSTRAQKIDTLTDSRDNRTYCVTKLGEQTWMAENLNFTIEESYCYKNKPENCKTFGRLYTLEAAKIACPSGWHLPSDEEWQQLEKFLGMDVTELTKNNAWRGTNQGSALLSDSTVGFNILLGGFRNPPSNNNLKDMQAFFWTSTEQDGFAYFRQFYIKSAQIFRRTRPKSWAFSVRCVKDQ